jgi:hypothetical protein
MCITRKVLPEDTGFPCEKPVVNFLNKTGYAGGPAPEKKPARLLHSNNYIQQMRWRR